MDDTFITQKEVNKQDFLQHINSVDPAIQFAVEKNKEDCAIPFLDTIVKPEADWNLSVTVYRKPTNTDQYLHWDSHHHLSVKFSVINTLTHRAQTVCSNPELLCKEMDHLRKVITQCKYPQWLWTRLSKGLTGPLGRFLMGLTIRAPQVPNPLPMKSKQRVILLYLLCESIKICGRYAIHTHFKGSSTIKNLLVSPKDKDPMFRKSGAIYWF